MIPNASPLIACLSLVISCAIFAIFFGGGWLWWQIAQRFLRGEEIVPYSLRRRVPWGIFDLFVGVLLWFVLMIAALTLLKRTVGIDVMTELPNTMSDDLARMMVDSVARILALSLLAGLIMLRTGCAVADLGWSWRHLPADLVLGGKAFLVLALQTFAIQLALTQIWPSEHPLIEALKEEKESRFIVMAFFMAVISAPLSEEFLFRVLFQGWLEKLFDAEASQKPYFGETLLLGERVTAASPLPPAELIDLTNPYAPPQGIEEPAAGVEEVSEVVPNSSANAFTPLIISALVFALMHYSHGPDWVALLVLALGLGYLYRRTHRILPGLVVHFLLNLLSMCSLCFEIFK